MTPVSTQSLIAAILCAGILPLGVSSQVVTFSGKLEEKIICDVAFTPAAQWNENLLNGTSIPLFTFQNGEVLSVKPKIRKYDDFSATLESDKFSLTITTVEKDDGGTYGCVRFGSSTLMFVLEVEALPGSFDVICSNSPSCTCGGPDEVFASSVDCTCTATEVSPRSLQLQWSISPSNVIRNQKQDAGAYFNLINEVTITPTSNEESVTCSLAGYQSEGINSSLIMRTFNFVSPECTLKVISFDDMCSTAELNCECTGGMPDTYTYSFFYGNKSRIGDFETPNVVVDIIADETLTFYCRGCNGIYGETSLDEKADILCTLGFTTLPTTTPKIETGDDPTQRSAPALIAICCVEGAVIVAMIFVIVFLYTIRKGSRKEAAQSFEAHFHEATDKTSTAYIDLQETKQRTSNHVNVEVPFENLTLQAPFPCKGLMMYRKAQMTLTSKREEIVVKTVSDDAPVRLAKLQADEVRKLATLTSNANVTQFLGRCNNVPNLLCYEFVNGTKLGQYLRENFQPSKIHQYGNTKQKRYHVPEKGSVEILPKVALQIARGMKYLTAQKFLHPGLRSEKVLIDASGQCKLYDFVSNDNAKDILAILWGELVPYQWMPPEYLFLEKLDPSVDVWSFGVLMWEIFSYGALPHKGKGRNDVEKELRGKENLPLPNNCPGAIWQITLNCWDQSPEKRPSFDHLSFQLSHMCNDNKEYDEIQSR